MEKAFSSIIVKAMALADTVSDQWFVIQYYGAGNTSCGMLDTSSVPQNITTTDCGSVLLSDINFIIDHVILLATLLITAVMTGVNGTYIN